MTQSKVLALHFSCANGKKYNVRVKDAKEDLISDAIQRAAKVLIQTKNFDFDGSNSAYQLESAT